MFSVLFQFHCFPLASHCPVFKRPDNYTHIKQGHQLRAIEAQVPPSISRIRQTGARLTPSALMFIRSAFPCRYLSGLEFLSSHQASIFIGKPFIHESSLIFNVNFFRSFLGQDCWLDTVVQLET